MQQLLRNKNIASLMQAYQPIWALSYLSGLAGWDTETYMPVSGAAARGSALGKASSLIQSLLLSKDFLATLAKAEKEKDLNEFESSLVKKLRRNVDDYQKIPASFLEQFQEVTSQAQLAWRKAKETSDFSIFEKHLAAIVKLSQQQAEYIGYQDHAYNALLDEFEEGSTVNQLDAYFESMKPFITDIVARISTSDHFMESHPLEKANYDQKQMTELNLKVLSMFNYDPQTLRLDISSHPFTSTFVSQDVRITTWYHDQDFARSLLATIHEYGHALHSLQSHPEFDQTPLITGDSLGMDESQSRFWENFIGRSQVFIEQIMPEIQSLGKDLKKLDSEEIYRYFNLVKPSLLRVEADEVTYHVHILIRYELEKALISGELSVKDLPEAWNAKYKDYLGVTVPNDAQGVLQDIHWAFGAIGYFPTYSTGTVLSATWKAELEAELGLIDELLKQPDGVSKIQDWQKAHIHQYGSTFTFNEHIKRETGAEFSLEPWKAYLTQKYSTLYHL